MAVKKPASAKKKATKKTTTAKRKPATKSTNKPSAKKGTTTAKKSAAKKSTAKKTTAKNVKNVSKPKSKRGGLNRELNEDTGFVVGTDQDTIALALLEGGESRSAIADALAKKIGTETRNGTEKQITNMISGVLNKMLDRGFTIDQSFIVLPPTPASKRAAARKRKK